MTKYGNLQFSLPYLWPDQNFDALFMTAATVTVTAFVDGLIDNVENVASSKKTYPIKD